MSYTYRYLGDLPTVFINLRKDDQTWCPNKGDTYTSPIPVQHPLLELLTEVKDEPPTAPVAAEDPVVDEDDDDYETMPDPVVPLMPS